MERDYEGESRLRAVARSSAKKLMNSPTPMCSKICRHAEVLAPVVVKMFID